MPFILPARFSLVRSFVLLCLYVFPQIFLCVRFSLCHSFVLYVFRDVVRSFMCHISLAVFMYFIRSVFRSLCRSFYRSFLLVSFFQSFCVSTSRYYYGIRSFVRAFVPSVCRVFGLSFDLCVVLQYVFLYVCRSISISFVLQHILCLCVSNWFALRWCVCIGVGALVSCICLFAWARPTFVCVCVLHWYVCIHLVCTGACACFGLHMFCCICVVEMGLIILAIVYTSCTRIITTYSCTRA